MVQKLSLTEALRRASNADGLQDMPERLRSIITAYEGMNDIHPQLRFDIFTILKGAIELAAAAVNRNYPAEAVVANACNVMGAVSQILQHATNDRPGQIGYGLMHNTSRQLLPGFFYSQQEAQSYIERFGNMLPSDLVIVPVKLTSQHLTRPVAPAIRPPPVPIVASPGRVTPLPEPPKYVAAPAPAKELPTVPAPLATTIPPPVTAQPAPTADPLADVDSEIKAIKASMEPSNGNT